MKRFYIRDDIKVFYIADTHFGHTNILKLCHRPFKNVKEMNEILIQNWNAVVGEKDMVFVVGDFCLSKSKDPHIKTKEAKEYLDRLHGQKHLIIGNHDKFAFDCFSSAYDSAFITHQGMNIVLSHYPQAEWTGFYRGVKHFYGHIHNNETPTHTIMQNIPGAYNVGADLLNFTPRTAEEIMKGE